jgi:hypothetical protein
MAGMRLRPGDSVPPPLTEAEVAEAEQELGVAFPDEYREHLVQVSSGGAVHRLRRDEEGWWWAGNDRWRRRLLRTPFPHPDSYAEADAELDAREPQRTRFPDEQTYQAARQAWDDECEAFEDRRTAGAVIAQEHGCGFATLLVVTGPLAGTMWWDGRATCDRILPLSLDHSHDPRPVTFGQWLQHGSWNLLPPDWGTPG